jgi:hypothetical protein
VLASSKSPLFVFFLQISSSHTKTYFLSKVQTEKTKNLKKTAKTIMQEQSNKMLHALVCEDFRKVFLMLFSILLAMP